jgi:hypothetical protein
MNLLLIYSPFLLKIPGNYYILMWVTHMCLNKKIMVKDRVDIENEVVLKFTD